MTHTATKFICPECEQGTISIVEAQTEQSIIPGYFIIGKTEVETRLRDCFVAACNVCEFCREVKPDGRLVDLSV
jgi:hypothetical protein